MNNIVAGVIGFVAGAAIGGGTAYAILKGKLENKYSKLEEELRHAYDIKTNRIDQSEAVKVDGVDILVDPILNDIEAQKEYYMRKLEDLGYAVGEYDLDDEDDFVNPVYDEDEAPEEPISGIELLSYNDYIRIDDTNLKHISLTYYAEDKTIADDTDAIVPEWKELVGDEWIDELSDDNHTCFVVNHDSGILADIEYMEGSYKEIVEGVASDEEENDG